MLPLRPNSRLISGIGVGGQTILLSTQWHSRVKYSPQNMGYSSPHYGGKLRPVTAHSNYKPQRVNHQHVLYI